jgi:ActR/RegA family two-component response regulator
MISNKKHSILLVDNEQAIHTNLIFAFEKEYDFFSIYTETGLIKVLRNEFLNDIDIIILDLNLIDDNQELGYEEGLKNISEIRKVDSEIPILVLTSSPNQYHPFEALKIGATQFLYKSEYEKNWRIPLNIYIKRPKLIFIDDDDTFLKNIEFAFIQNAFEVDVKKITEFQELEIDKETNLILLDLDLGNGVSYKYLEYFKQKYSEIPIIVISNNLDYDTQVNLNKLNAVEKIINKKDYNYTKWMEIFYSVIEQRDSNTNSVIQKTSLKKINMNHNNERIEAINGSLSRCVNKYKLHLKDFEAESEALAFDGKEGMKKFNSKISELEYELFSFTSGIPEDEKEVLIEEMKESRNPDKSMKERSTAKQRAIELLKKYGPRVLEIGGAVALTLILKSLGLSLGDIGLGD